MGKDQNITTYSRRTIRVESKRAMLLRLKRLESNRNDNQLMELRDVLLRMYTGPIMGEFIELIHRFDDIVVDRWLDGRMRRYKLALRTLRLAVEALPEKKTA